MEANPGAAWWVSVDAMSSLRHLFAPPVAPSKLMELKRPTSLLSYRTAGPLVGFLDLVLIVGTSVASGIVYHLLMFDRIGNLAAFFAIGAYSAALFILLTASRGLYHTSALLAANRQVRRVASGWTVVALVVISLLFLLKISEEYSRGSVAGFEVIGLALLLVSRASVAASLGRLMSREALSGDRTVVLGDREELARLASRDLLRQYGVSEIARYELFSSRNPRPLELRHDLETVEAAIAVARQYDVAKVLLAIRWDDEQRRELICERLRSLPASVMLLPDRFVGPILSHAKVGPDLRLQMELQRAPLSPIELAIKRSCDLVVTAISLIALAPLLVLVSIAIAAESRGPIIFRQNRKGFNGKQFAIYKFRTLKVAEDGDAVKQVTRQDERLTRIGQILRATSIDELPQLVNVLKGDMSLVGPRPHAVVHDNKYADLVANYALRHHVKPGMTGWAQVNGFRGETAAVELMQRRVSHDLWYVNNWSFWLDLRILGLTCIEVVRGRNAF
jgi:undecaprenyl-phosphate galactose phosphotransferase/putative colanic acid biosynthesis UDP-glucose lipid carrier transferase